MHSKREKFIHSIFTEDIKTLLEWHNAIPLSERNLLILFVDEFYKFMKRLNRKRVPVDDDPISDGVTVSSGSSGSWISSIGSCLNAWMGKRRNIHDDISTLDGSSFTNFSELTRTSVGSRASIKPLYKVDYQFHRRAFSINHRTWESPVAFKESTTRTTSVHRTEPVLRRPVFDAVLLEGVFQKNQIPRILKFLKESIFPRMEKLPDLFRSLHSLRRLSHYDTTNTRLMCTRDDSRIWAPGNPKALMGKYDLYSSKVPIGTIGIALDALSHGEDPRARLEGILITRAHERSSKRNK
jgi:hypothetical protein